MDMETAIKVINETLVAKQQKPLSQPEKTIIQGTWQKLTYEQMAESSPYSRNYLMRDIGPQFWNRLSQAFAEKVSKTNFLSVLEGRLLLSRESFEPISSENQQKNVVESKSKDKSILYSPYFQWSSDDSEVFSLSVCYDREPQLSSLKQWLLKEQCRLVVLRGLGGMGKTTLARKLTQEVKNHFDAVVWISLAPAPSLQVLLKSLLAQDALGSTTTTPELLSQLIGKMRLERWLLVLDGLESILQTGQLAGSYQVGYENYRELCQHLILESHQSCLLIVSREIPLHLHSYLGQQSPVRALTLGGLPEPAASLILQAEGIEKSPSWSQLTQHYQGNPAALKIAAQIIRELFNGNGAEFLTQGTLVFGEIAQLIASSFERLSAGEKEIVYWLASEGRPLSLEEIQVGMSASLYQTELLEALSSLEQRLLVETTIVEGTSKFSLPTMVMEYVSNLLYQELRENNTAHEANEATISLSAASQQPTHLSSWLHNQPSPPWQSLSTLLGVDSLRTPPRLRGAFYLRGQKVVKRFKKVKLGNQSDSLVVALLLALRPESQTKIGIRVQLHPFPITFCLPDHLKLILSNDTGDVLKEIVSQKQDNFIQLPKITGLLGEAFQLQIMFNDTHITEQFLI